MGIIKSRLDAYKTKVFQVWEDFTLAEPGEPKKKLIVAVQSKRSAMKLISHMRRKDSGCKFHIEIAYVWKGMYV